MRVGVRLLGCGVALAIATLAGCASKADQALIDVCARAAQEKIGDQNAEIDLESMRAAVARDPDGSWQVGGEVWFERGMHSERKQTIVCRGRDAADGKGEPEVTLLQFLW